MHGTAGTVKSKGNIIQSVNEDFVENGETNFTAGHSKTTYRNIFQLLVPYCLALIYNHVK